MDECEHHYVLDNIDPQPTATGRTITFHCQMCQKPGSIVTTKTDTEINGVFAEAAPA